MIWYRYLSILCVNNFDKSFTIKRRTDLKKNLVVDLDHTLLKSDMLHESFWSALSGNMNTLLLSIFYIMRDKAALKYYLSLKTHNDPEILPYNQEVISYILSFKKQGRRTALVIAPNQSLADQVAKHLSFCASVESNHQRIASERICFTWLSRRASKRWGEKNQSTLRQSKRFCCKPSFARR